MHSLETCRRCLKILMHWYPLLWGKQLEPEWCVKPPKIICWNLTLRHRDCEIRGLCEGISPMKAEPTQTGCELFYEQEPRKPLCSFHRMRPQWGSSIHASGSSRCTAAESTRASSMGRSKCLLCRARGCFRWSGQTGCRDLSQTPLCDLKALVCHLG